MTITKERLRQIVSEEFRALQEECPPQDSSLYNFTEQELVTLAEHGIEIPQELHELAPLGVGGAAAGLAAGGRAAAGALGKVAVEIGEAYVVEKLSSSSGRNELADTLVATAKLAENLCSLTTADLNDRILARGAEKVGVQLPELLRGVHGRLCKMGVRFLVSPLNLLASAIRMMDDTMSGVIADKMKGGELPPEGAP